MREIGESPVPNQTKVLVGVACESGWSDRRGAILIVWGMVVYLGL